MLEAFLQSYNTFLQSKTDISFLGLFIFGFIGGLLSSLLPCVLSLLPVNLAYIGTLKPRDKLHAVEHASLFVLGVSIILTLLGLFTTFAFNIFTSYKGIISLIVGILVILMSLSLIDFIKIPFPHFLKSIPHSNPFVVGLAFALVSSPCSSPVLVSILGIAATTNSFFKSFLITFGYSLGYTAIIFTASLSTGLIKQLNWFKENNDKVIKFSAVFLFLIGVYYTIVGIANLL